MVEVVNRPLVGTSITPMKLNHANFYTWSKHVKQYLNNLNKLHLLDENSITPDQSNAVEFKQWKYDNVNILCSLFNSMEDSVYQVFRFLRTVSDLWASLVDRYANPKLLNYRKYQVYCELTQIKQGERERVKEYCLRFDAIWNEYASLYEEVFNSQGEPSKRAKEQNKQETFVFQFMWGLRGEFEPVRIRVLDMNPLPHLDEVFRFAREYESLLNMGNKHGSGMSTAAIWRFMHNQGPHEDEKIGNGCTYCGHTDHGVSSCYDLRLYYVRKSSWNLL